VDRVEVLVVGAGVVGLAVAQALARAGREVLVTERAEAIGTGVSSRSSEVVHAGLYYPTGSLKARLCVRGRALLYDWCSAHGVPHRRCGKLVVAVTPGELDALQALRTRAEANGVEGLQWLDRPALAARAPALSAHAALWSPASGIVDSHALMLSLLGAAEDDGALLALRSQVVAAQRVAAGWQVEIESDDGRHGPAERSTLQVRWLVNAAALGSHAVAAAMAGFPAAHIPPRHLAKGHYFALAGRPPFDTLVYPLPVDGGLGVHLTLDLGGQARFGPDVEWLPPVTDAAAAATVIEPDYAVDPSRAAAFETAVRAWWPGLPAGALQPAYAGVRPKISGPGEPAADFRIDGPSQHGVPGVVQLFGIESPGLTASLAIGEQVAAIVAAEDSR
jgi:L-2-hydroxyglutarate oxidase LhgO